MRKEPKRYVHLDAAQLVKHALGLKNRFPGATPKLLYLFWEPVNRLDWKECAKHRAEIADFQNRVRGCTVSLETMSYPELWADWDRAQLPAHLLEYLSARYLLAVPRT